MLHFEGSAGASHLLAVKRVEPLRRHRFVLSDRIRFGAKFDELIVRDSPKLSYLIDMRPNIQSNFLLLHVLQ
jgi:hypothetical protein